MNSQQPPPAGQDGRDSDADASVQPPEPGELDPGDADVPDDDLVCEPIAPLEGYELL